MRRLALLPLLLLLACDTAGSDSTYPPPGDYASVDLAALVTIDPGRYNATGFVVDYYECPPNTTCLLPDSVTLAETAGDEHQVTVTVLAERPSQFEIGARYRVSVEVTGEPGPARRFTLLGYERLD